MAARLLEPSSRTLPLRHGMLCASGLTLAADGHDAFDVVIGARGELTLVLLSIKTPEPADGEAEAALDAVREALRSGSPIYDVVSSVRAWAARERGRRVALSLMRFSQPDSRVEILNAGMPPIACAPPGGRLSLHAPLSRPIGERFGEVHPYELCPLVWGSAWFLLSEGATFGSLDSDSVRGVLMESELYQHAAELAASPPESLAPHIERLTARPRSPTDSSVVIVHADPTRRFESGIRG